MRFYFQSPGSDAEKVATKCIRVSNTATTERVIEALVQKFRPDMRMLTSHSSYALYEVHPDQGEREREREREREGEREREREREICVPNIECENSFAPNSNSLRFTFDSLSRNLCFHSLVQTN